MHTEQEAEKKPMAAHRSMRTTAGSEGLSSSLSLAAQRVPRLSWFLFLHLALGSCSFIPIAPVSVLFTILPEGP